MIHTVLISTQAHTNMPHIILCRSPYHSFGHLLLSFYLSPSCVNLYDFSSLQGCCCTLRPYKGTLEIRESVTVKGHKRVDWQLHPLPQFTPAPLCSTVSGSTTQCTFWLTLSEESFSAQQFISLLLSFYVTLIYILVYLNSFHVIVKVLSGCLLFLLLSEVM